MLNKVIENCRGIILG